MNEILKEKILNFFKENKIDYDDLILNSELNDEEYLFLLINIFNNKITEYKDLNEINYKELEISEISNSKLVKEFIEEMKEQIEKDEVIFYEKGNLKINITKIILKECIENIRYGIEFMDLYQESFIFYLENKKFFDELEIKDEKLFEYVISMIMKKSILLYQKEIIEKNKHFYLSHILYSAVKDCSHDELEKYNISHEYYHSLEKYFANNKIKVDDLEEKIKEIDLAYALALKTIKLNYKEEQYILSYLGINNIEIENNEILEQAILKLSLYEKNDVMDFYLKENKVKVSNTDELFYEFMEEMD